MARERLLLASLLSLSGCFQDLNGAPCETDRQCPAAQTCMAGRCVDGARPERLVALTATPTLAPATVSVGQPVTLTLEVKNTGSVDLVSVAPSGVLSTGAAEGKVTAGPTPPSVDRLAVGGTASFTYTLEPLAAGTLSFTATVQGTAVDDANAMAMNTAPSNTVTVQLPAALEITAFTAPPSVSRGQQFSATLTVTNRGQATANDVKPALPNLTATGGAGASSGPMPAGVALTGGQSTTFALTLTENGTASGTLKLATTVSGTDANSGATVTSASVATADVAVQTPAALSITGFTVPAMVGRGAMFDATLTVSNTGEAAANMVLPSPDPPMLTPTGMAGATTSTLQQAATIPGGGTKTFTWTYLETGTGTGTLKVATGLAGTDANSGAALTAASTQSNVATVQAMGALQVTSFTAPAVVSRGQTFTVTMVVQNSGGSRVDNVAPAPNPPTVMPTGAAAASTTTTPVPMNIAPGASATFTWTYAENGTGPGTLAFTAGVAGTDSTTGMPVSVAAQTTTPAQVQAAASLVVTSFSIPASLSRGQTLTATMVVSNTGQATANNVQPSPLPPQKTTTGGADATTTTVPMAVSIAGGASATFTWTYTENGTSAGTLQLTAGATGSDVNSGSALTAAARQTNVSAVQEAAALSITAFTIPTTVLRGRPFTATMTVQNTGGATATGVVPTPNPPSRTATGGADCSSTTTVNPVTLAAGASTTFTWTYDENGSAPGTLALAAGVTGTDANSLRTVTAPSSTSNTALVQNQGALTITAFTAPAALTRGQAFNVTLTVQNSGGSVVNGVAVSPNPPMTTATGQASASTASMPAAVNIAAGSSHTFTWAYVEDGSGAGTLRFSASVGGTDSVNGMTVTTGTATTPTVTVQTAPSLAVTSVTAPATVSRGQSFTVQLVVTNSGQATANNVLPSPLPPSLTATGTANASTSTVPAAANIPGGGSHTYSWTYVENGSGTGTLAFTAGAAGVDVNTGGTVSAAAATSAATTVQTRAQLSIAMFSLPSLIQRGTTFNVTMVVQNDGEAAANLVLPTPNPPTKVLTGGANATTSTTLTPASIAGGASRTFTWSYTENGTGPGTLQLSGTAAGTDANSGAAVTSAPASTNAATVQAPAQLDVPAFSITPAALTLGQAFVASMTVHNGGGTQADNVLPSTPMLTTTGGASAMTASMPSAVSLAPGASTTFTWMYSEGGLGAGTVKLTATASGTDAVSGLTVSTSPASTLVVPVQTPPSLTVTALTLPATLTRGQTFTATLTVRNDGQATAANVSPVPQPPTLTATGSADATTSSVPMAQSIPGGGTATFSWTWLETGTGTGTLRLNGGAAGIDANTGAGVSAAAASSNLSTVQLPPQLSVTAFTAPAIVMRGSTFTASITVENTGEAGAAMVLPAPNPPTKSVTGTANASTSTALTPASIAGGGSTTFNWSYTENGTGAGTLQLTAGAAGVDANSAAAISAAGMSTPVVTVQDPPRLVVTSFTLPPTLSRGQPFTASMTVQNQGGTQADNVVPSPNPPTPTVTGGAAATTSSMPAAVTLAPGASTTFTWSYTENGTGAGTFRLTAGASGTNSVTGGMVSATAASTNTAQIQTPAALTISAFTLPANLTRGQTFTATLTVTNSGQTTANGVLPSPLPPMLTATGSASASTSTTPAAQNIAGGASASFTYTYVENGTGTGTLRLSASAAGTDANTGAAVSAATANTNVANVQTPPSLSVTSFTVPATLSRGQTFTATLTVTNSGQAAASNVLPAPNPPTKSLTGGANATTTTAQTGKSIAGGGGTATFTWTYTENGTGTGTLALSTGVTGTDANSGGAVSAGASSTNTATVMRPAALTSSLTATPAVVAGNPITVRMTVNNTGDATATAVTPTLSSTPTGAVTLTLSSGPSPQAISGGSSATFTWVYDTGAANNGSVVFNGNAAGNDANSGAAVSSPSTSSPSVPVIPPASAGLASTLTLSPRTAALGELVTVTMSVRNNTAGTLNGVAASSLTLAGPGGVTLVSGPTPATQNVGTGQTVPITWTYRTTTPGWVTFTGNATSTTPANASAPATSSHLTIPSGACHLSTLTANAGADRSATCNANAALGGVPSASGGAGNYRYEWTPAANLSSATTANPNATPRVASTTYSLRVTDAEGCSATDSVVVTVTNAPTTGVITSAQPEDRGCSNPSNPGRFTFASALTCPAGGCAHLWDFADGTTSTQASPSKGYSAVGTFSVVYRATDVNGCFATATLPVFVGTGTSVPIGRLTLTPSVASVAADGTSTLSFSSQALSQCSGTAATSTSAMRFTVMVDRGTITDADVDGATPGIQVNQVAVTGGFGVRFTVRADRFGGTVRARAQAIAPAGAAARGWGTAAFTGSTLLPVVSDAAPEGATGTNPTRVGFALTKALNAATVTSSSLTLQQVGAGTCAAPSGAAVSGTASYNPNTQAALLQVSGLNVATTAYVAKLTTAARDTNNNMVDGNLNGTGDGSPGDDATFCFGALADATAPATSCSSLSAAVISPDGDGQADSTTLSANVSDAVGLKAWRVVARDETTGAPVRTLVAAQSTNGAVTLAWDGRDALGKVVPNGNYTLSASSLDTSFNRSAACNLSLSVSSPFDSSELSPP